MGFELWMDPEEWRSRVRQSQLTGLPADLTGLYRPNHKLPNPPAERCLRVRALTANWRMDGEVVTVGEAYRVSENEAHRLVLTGKGELA